MIRDPEVAGKIRNDAGDVAEAAELAAHSPTADQTPRRVELRDSVRAADIEIAVGGAREVVVDGEGAGREEATGRGGGSTGLAFVVGLGGAEVAFGLGTGGFNRGLVDVTADHLEEVAGGVELLDSVVVGVGGVDIVSRFVDGDAV
jgi:hypothetical protein